MPPEGEGAPLSPDEIGILRAWIDQGASWPAVAQQSPAAVDHWSFKLLQRPRLPHVADASWGRNPIDSFVKARLEAENIAPSPPVDRATLIRRLSLDLLGLPPSPADVERFVGDSRPDACERLVWSGSWHRRTMASSMPMKYHADRCGYLTAATSRCCTS